MPKTHPHKEGHSREIMCVGWPWVGATVDPFVLWEGEQAAEQRDPLSEQCWGLMPPPESSESPTSACNIIDLLPGTSTLEPSWESQMQLGKLVTGPTFSSSCSNTPLPFSSAEWDRCSDRTLSPYTSRFPVLIPSPCPCPTFPQGTPEESRFGLKTQEADIREQPWTF